MSIFIQFSRCASANSRSESKQTNLWPSYGRTVKNGNSQPSQQDKKSRTTQMTTLKAQVQGLEEQIAKFKLDIERYKNENGELNNLLGEEQRKVINLSSECTTNSASKQALTETEEKLRDAQKENSILRGNVHCQHFITKKPTVRCRF